ncbi:MAG TPA: hypothetical protein VF318_08760 [Dehalococcoidales bacterium]
MSVLVSDTAWIVAGRLSDRLGPKIVLMFCALLLATGYGLLTPVHDVWQLYSIYTTVTKYSNACPMTASAIVSKLENYCNLVA